MNEGRLIADRPVGELLALFREEHYRIRVRGSVNGSLSPLEGLTVSEADGESVITGPISDQEHLHDVLERVRSLGLPLLSVERAEPDLEDVFIRLLEDV